MKKPPRGQLSKLRDRDSNPNFRFGGVCSWNVLARRANGGSMPALAVRPSEATRYSLTMQIVWKGRLTQTAAKYADMAPAATTCCNACRTCVQTNLFTAALAGVAAAGAFLARRFRTTT